uniref:Vitelline membrane outer layer protein 1 homolog isoform X1 n=1 Tax=Crassostrea virginica TaxID=6565 RepID=A0A8B8AH87_CRAVI|nr:vitelline membrane outer layer protein 1 homolog isoform X1 [Crassostrea virginica]
MKVERFLIVIVASLYWVEGREITKILTVKGGDWGSWGEIKYCPEGSFADGYKMQIEPPQGFGDDTSLNRVSLSCRDAETLEKTGNVTPYSNTRSFGSWGSETSCHKGQFLTSFALQVEKPQGAGDDTAANFVKFTCRNKTEGEPSVLYQQPGAGYWGSFGEWSEICPLGSAICGLQQMIEPFHGLWTDDTELNNLKFYCCQ